MEEERNKILAKARKIKQLSEQGVDGEKETAKKMYVDFIKKNCIKDEEVLAYKEPSEFDSMDSASFFNNVDVDMNELVIGILTTITGRILKSDKMSGDGLKIMINSFKGVKNNKK